MQIPNSIFNVLVHFPKIYKIRTVGITFINYILIIRRIQTVRGNLDHGA